MDSQARALEMSAGLLLPSFVSLGLRHRVSRACRGSEGFFVIARYTHPEMGRIWSDQRRYETWLLVETAAAEAMAAAGIVPAEAARDIRERGAFDIARIEAIEQITQHDVIAFTTAVAEHVGPSARWLHFGMTSSDVIDTAQALQMREACDVILKDLDELADAVRDRAVEHRRTPMIGRTHGVHAEPMTFGLKLALWYAEIDRDIERVRRARTTVSVGKLSGAVGTFAHLPPVYRSRRLSTPRSRRPHLSPRRSSSAIDTPNCWRRWPLRRRRSRNSRSKFAACRRPRSERSRSRLPRGRKARRRCRTNATRSGASRSSAWRGSFAATVRRRSRTSRSGTSATSRTRRSSGSFCPTASSRSTTCCDGSRASFAAWWCTPTACGKISNRSRGVVFSGTVLLELATTRRHPRGCVLVGAAQCHAVDRRAPRLQESAARRIRIFHAILTPAEIDRAFDLDEQFRYVDHIFDRVFSASDAAAAVVSLAAVNKR